MNNFFEWIKNHPFLSAGIVLSIGVLWLLLRGGGGNQGVAYNYGPTASEIQAGTQLQALQLQAQQAANQTAAAAAVRGQEVSATLEIAKIQGLTAQNANLLSAQTAQKLAELEAGTQTAVSTLQAQVAGKQVEAATQQQQIQAAAYTTISAQNNATQQAIASLPYQLEQLKITTAADIAKTQINTQAAANAAAIAALQQQLTNFGNSAGSNFTEIQYAIDQINRWTQKYFGGTVALDLQNPSQMLAINWLPQGHV